MRSYQLLCGIAACGRAASIVFGVVAGSVVAGQHAQAVRDQDPPGLRNGGFEQSSDGELPERWVVVGEGYSAATSEERAVQGRRCARLIRGEKAGQYGGLVQSVDATRCRGSVLVLKAYLRTGGSESCARLWMSASDAKGRQQFIELTPTTVSPSDWQQYEIHHRIDETAVRVGVGALLVTGQELWIDDVQIEIRASEQTPAEPPRSPTDRGLVNIEALARLYGYVRYFHPSEAGVAADWDLLVLDGVRKVEDAPDAGALASALQAWVESVAPSVRIIGAGEQDPPGIAAPGDLAELRVVAWEHRGVRMGNHGESSAYSSRRIYRPALAPGDLPVVGEPLRLPLSSGLHCLLPVTSYADQAGPLPRTAATPREAGLRPTPADRSTRLAAVVMAWNVFQHFYPYFDVVDCDWVGVLTSTLRRAAMDADAQALLITLRRMVSSLEDGHASVTHFVDSRVMFPAVRLSYVEGEVVVTARGGESALRLGDIVEQIDGVDAEVALSAAMATVSAATIGHKRRCALNEILRGVEGSSIRLGYVGAGGRAGSVSLPRVAPRPMTERRPDPIVELEPAIYYVDVERVSGLDLKNVLARLAQAKGVIFDVRGYPWKLKWWDWLPYLMKERGLSQKFLTPRTVYPDRMKVAYAAGREWRFRPRKPHIGARCVFLVDERAVSYSESCMAIVAHYELGEIVGQTTAGTNGNINAFQVIGGYGFVFTGMKVVNRDGSRHHGVGVQPTVRVAPSIAGVRAEKDEILDRALSLLRGK